MWFLDPQCAQIFKETIDFGLKIRGKHVSHAKFGLVEPGLEVQVVISAVLF